MITALPTDPFLLSCIFLSTPRGEDNLESYRRSAYPAVKWNESQSQRARTYQGNNLTNGTVLPVEIYERAGARMHLCATLFASFGYSRRSVSLSMFDFNFQGYRSTTTVGQRQTSSRKMLSRIQGSSSAASNEDGWSIVTSTGKLYLRSSSWIWNQQLVNRSPFLPLENWKRKLPDTLRLLPNRARKNRCEALTLQQRVTRLASSCRQYWIRV